MDLIGRFLLIVGVVACVAAPTILRLLNDTLTKRSIAAHNLRTQYVLGRMRLTDLECEREINRAMREQGGRKC